MGLSRMEQVNPKLIVDIGASDGNDIQYYLRKGLDVIGLEADPVMHARLEQRFAAEVAGGTVIPLNRVAAETSGQLVQYWRNERFQGLSTFDFDTAQFREHLVPCSGRTADWREIVALRGAPHYCKIDIEGGEVPLSALDVRFRRLPHVHLGRMSQLRAGRGGVRVWLSQVQVRQPDIAGTAGPQSSLHSQ